MKRRFLGRWSLVSDGQYCGNQDDRQQHRNRKRKDLLSGTWTPHNHRQVKMRTLGVRKAKEIGSEKSSSLICRSRFPLDGLPEVLYAFRSTSSSSTGACPARSNRFFSTLEQAALECVETSANTLGVAADYHRIGAGAHDAPGRT